MKKNRIPILLLALIGWGAVLASDLPAPLLERVHGSDVAEGARYYEEYRNSPKELKPEDGAQEDVYLFMSTVSAIAQSPMAQLAFFCVPENVPVEALYEKVAPILLREKWLWQANGRVLVLAALSALYPCRTARSQRKKATLPRGLSTKSRLRGPLRPFRCADCPRMSGHASARH